MRYPLESSGKFPVRASVFAGTVTVLVLIGQVLAYPSAVRNVLTLGFAPGTELHYPLTYSLLSPFFQIADRINILSQKQIFILFFYINTAWLVWRVIKYRRRAFKTSDLLQESIRFTGLNVLLVLSLLTIVVIPRPEASIAMTDPDVLVLDFHTHTNRSWDGQIDATPLRQMQKRAKEGFNAFFITDHNHPLSALEAGELSERRSLHRGAVALGGEEISSRPGNLIVLGPKGADTGIEGMSTRIGHLKYKALGVVLKNREDPDTFVYATSAAQWWQKREILDTVVKAGLDGIEVAKASPRGLNMTVQDRQKLADFARRHGLVMLGSTDDHGYGSAPYVWNLVRLPGWRELDPRALMRAIVRKMRKEGPGALTVVTRIKAEPSNSMFLMGVDPLRQVWEMVRSLPGTQAVVFIAYSWMPFLAILLKRRVVIRWVPVRERALTLPYFDPKVQPMQKGLILRETPDQRDRAAPSRTLFNRAVSGIVRSIFLQFSRFR